VFRHQLSALTLLAAFTMPLAASAQSLPGPQPAGPGVTAPAMHARPGQHRRHHPNRFFHALRALNLTPQQKQQIAGDLHAARAAERQAHIASARALRRQIDGVLTADQRTQLRTALERSHPAPGAGFGAPNPPAQ
jgi:Spy/CpxP family protein refolding chaperone